MNQVTVVTGALRSGTSCITGLLEQCGFDLGTNIRVLRKRCEQNPKGHFELDLLYTINERLIIEGSDGVNDIINVCDQKLLAHIADQRTRYFELFLQKFDGDLCKDPLFCLTLPYWKKHWPEQKKTIFCLRHPYAVAQSIAKRYRVSEQQGVKTWQTYVERFFNHVDQDEVFILDFDHFIQSPLLVFSHLLHWLEKPSNSNDLQVVISKFFSSGYVHWEARNTELSDIYQNVMPFYQAIKQQATQQQRVYRNLTG